MTANDAQPQDQVPAADQTVPQITPDEAARRLPAALLVDVRERAEWEAGHAPDAQHTPLDTLAPDALPHGATVLCICRSGNRSSTATAMLRAAGVDACNVTGGMNAWIAAGLPVVRDDGRVGTII